ncbi:MAG: TonB-dependent receptor [Flavobacteriales bacterium]|nr:TonB-dependent receptor [Flavobacteriales bacterium]MDG1765555.1 TonB-dependent receptor [Flavobacteriales bacterium]
MKKLIFIAIWLSLILSASAQDSLLRISLPVAHVTEVIDLVSPKNSADSLQEAWSKSGSIGDLLLKNGQTIIRPYGPPGSAITAASQGLLGDHFSVLWNGFEMNSPSLGLTDFSQLPAQFFENHQSHQHVSSSAFAYGSGAGGMISLNNAYSAEQELKLAHSSLNNQSYALKSAFELGNVKLQTKLFKRKASNEFEFVDYYKFQHPVLKQEHNNHDLLAFMQSIYGGDRWKWNAHLWLQEANTAIPEPLGSFGQAFAQQSDGAVRLSGSIKRSFEKMSLRFSAAHFFTKQRYTDQNSLFGEYLIDSRIKTLQQSLRGELAWYFEQTKLFVKTNVERQEATTNTYKNEEVLALNQSVGLHHQREKWDLLTLLRGDVNSQANPFLLGDVSLNLRPLERVQARLNASRIYRLPDLNERFWGGDEERFLAAEEGWKGSIQVQGQPLKKAAWKSSFLSASYTQILMDQMIQWLPNSSGVFRPLNSGEAKIQQFQFKLFLERRGQVVMNLLAKCQVQNYMNAPFWLAEHQLDQNNVRLSVDGNLEYKHYHLNAAWRYRQNDYFPGIPDNWRFNELHLFDLGVGKRISKNRSHLMFVLQCQNIFNVAQQFLPTVAMPGRVWEIQFQLSINQKTK